MKAKRILCFVFAIVMIVSMSVSSCIIAYADYAFVDEENTSKEFTHEYYLHSYEGEYTDVKTVKITWSIYGIGVYRYEAKKWNPDTLKWEDDNNNDNIEKYESTSFFYLTNLSAKKVQVMIDYASEEQFHPTVSYSGVDAETHKTVLNSVVKSDHSIDTSINNNATISVTVTPENEFGTLEETDGTKYGTFTLTLCTDYCLNEDILKEIQQDFIDLFGKENLEEVLALSSSDFYSKIDYTNEQYSAMATKVYNLVSDDYTFEWVSALDDGTVEPFNENHTYRLTWLTRITCKEHPSVSIIVALDG